MDIEATVNLYYLVLAILIMLAGVFALVSLVMKVPGYKLFWKQLSLSFFSSAVPLVIIRFITPEASPWFLFVAPLFFIFTYWKLIRVMGVKVVKLKRRTSLDENDDGLRVAHLSDFHVCLDSTLEGELPSGAVIEAARSSLKWVMKHKPDLVVLTGDITDWGKKDEWKLFTELLNEFSANELQRIVIIPGNHDLTLAWGNDYVPGGRDGNLFVDFEKRCADFVKYALIPFSQVYPQFLDGKKKVALSELLASTSDYRSLYEQHPPRVETLTEQVKGIGPRLVDNIRNLHVSPHEVEVPLSEYVPAVVVHPDLLEAAKQSDAGLWPTSKHYLIKDLIELIYPLIVFENEHYIVIALNSNTKPGFSVADGAVGMLGDYQLKQLERLLQLHSQKCAIILIHHHLGAPSELIPWYKPWLRLELKTLQLEECHELGKLLSEHHSSVVMHGHKHKGYWAMYQGVTVLSGASVAYGNNLGGDSCYVYDINHEGRVRVVAHEKNVPA